MSKKAQNAKKNRFKKQKEALKDLTESREKHALCVALAVHNGNQHTRACLSGKGLSKDLEKFSLSGDESELVEALGLLDFKGHTAQDVIQEVRGKMLDLDVRKALGLLNEDQSFLYLNLNLLVTAVTEMVDKKITTIRPIGRGEYVPPGGGGSVEFLSDR